MGDEFYRHTCDACVDGTEYEPPRTAKEERADVLAWLNRQGGRAAWTLISEIEQLHHVGAAQREGKWKT